MSTMRSNRNRLLAPRTLATTFVALLLLTSPPGSSGQHGKEETAPAAVLPPEVEELFQEVDGEGQPILGATERAAFAALPSHAQQLFLSAMEEGLVEGAHQTRTLLGLKVPAQKLEMLLQDNCVLCHTNPDMQEEETLFLSRRSREDPYAHLDLTEFVSDVHSRRGLSCSGCHGGTPQDLDMADEIYERWPDSDVRHEDRTWIPAFCSSCHSDPAFMRGFNPALATDQMAKYATSRHGKLLLEDGDSNAAQCASCHRTHGIRRSDSRMSSTHPSNIAEMCGACHANSETMRGYRTRDGSPMPTNQLAQYRESVHGKALIEKGDLGAPTCNDCHGNHAAMPPEVASVSQICRTCHATNGRLFDTSQHRQAFGRNGWPECGKCHGKHAIAPTSDDMMRPEPGGLCYDCHAEYSANNPECQATATYFYETITALVSSAHHFEEEVEALATKGVDVENLNATVESLQDAIRESRSRVHSFDASDFDQTASAGRKAAEEGDQLIQAGKREHSVRQRGLIVAIVFMGLLSMVIYGKLRRIERKPVAAPPERA